MKELCSPWAELFLRADLPLIYAAKSAIIIMAQFTQREGAGLNHLTSKRRGLLDFIARVLAQAERGDMTKAERAGFIVIARRDLDEFLTVRCPEPGAKTLARVTALLDRMEMLAETLVPDAPDDPSEAPRVLRRADVSADDSAEGVAACLAARAQGAPVLLECGCGTEAQARETLGLPETPAYVWRCCSPEKRLEPLLRHPPEPFAGRQLMADDWFALLRAGDRLLIHPYDSIAPVTALLRQASVDEATVRIRMTLYRTDEASAFTEALCRAAARGKQVEVLIEVRARGDEARNLALTDQLTRAGAKVIHPTGERVHGKLLLIERREAGALRGYVHFGTGNYHAGNSRRYTDVSLMTADETLCADAAAFFEAASAGGEAECELLRTSPEQLRAELTRLIRREMSHALAGRPCGVTAKLNALTDPALIERLTDAGRAGVPIDLIVRGACRLQPGVPGRTENIRVRSLVGRELEHARVCRFVNGGAPETFISSADWMPRSLDRRRELLIPVRGQRQAARLGDWLCLQLADTRNAWLLQGDHYDACDESGGQSVDSQAQMKHDPQ